MKKLTLFAAILLVFVAMSIGSNVESQAAITTYYYAVVFDTSGSIPPADLANGKNATNTLVGLMPANPAGRIKSFDGPASVPTNHGPWTTSKPTLQYYVGTVGPGTAGTTALYDAIIEACNDLGARAGLRFLVVWTDCGENASVGTLAAVTAAIVGNGVIPIVLQYNWASPPTDIASVGTIVPAMQAAIAGAGGYWYTVPDAASANVAVNDIVNHVVTPTIPTLSQWGMIVLVVLILASAIVLLRRRRKAASACS